VESFVDLFVVFLVRIFVDFVVVVDFVVQKMIVPDSFAVQYLAVHFGGVFVLGLLKKRQRNRHKNNLKYFIELRITNNPPKCRAIKNSIFFFISLIH
jgi:hypothetical protein